MGEAIMKQQEGIKEISPQIKMLNSDPIMEELKGIYSKQDLYLKEIIFSQEGKLSADATFFVGQQPHLKNEYEHTGAIDLTKCAVQASNAFMAALAEKGHVREWGALTPSEFFARLEQRLIASTSFDYLKQIPPRQEFHAAITIESSRTSGSGNYHVLLNINFADGACVGKLRYVLVPSKKEKSIFKSQALN